MSRGVSVSMIERRCSNRLDDRQAWAYTEGNRRPRCSASLMRKGGALFYPVIALMILSLFACQPAGPTPSSSPTSSSTPIIATEEPEATSMPSPSPTVTAQPTESIPGSVEQIIIQGSDGAETVVASVYLPPRYAENTEVRFPVLYLLHGLLYTDTQWIELGIVDVADSLITNGDMVPFLIVMPRETRSDYYETSIMDILIPYIDQHYRTQSEGAFRAIGGLSRGGGWAARIGLHFPDQFASIGLHSPANFTTAPYYDYWIKHADVDSLPRIWIDIGERDSLLVSTENLAAIFDLLDIPYEFHILPGDHVEDYWSGNLAAYLRWYAEPWNE